MERGVTLTMLDPILVSKVLFLDGVFSTDALGLPWPYGLPRGLARGLAFGLKLGAAAMAGIGRPDGCKGRRRRSDMT